MKTFTRAQARAIYAEVQKIDVDSLSPVTNERVTLDRFAKMLRPELKKLGLTNRKVSVTVPNYSMVQAIDVRLPQIDYNEERTNQEVRDDYFERRVAANHLREVILALFPNNDGRYGEGGIWSDSYYFTFSVD